ncbi:MAG TPA: tryptophan synthase subunit beta [Longimicrobiales bacterium]|nr:tryptophan synthase subunit beta [Longimicrobiales bacterium]
MTTTTTTTREPERDAAAADAPGRFGPYGGRYVPETLVRALDELAEVFEALRDDDAFDAELSRLLVDYVGRPTPLMRARRLEAAAGPDAPCIWLKREDLCHTGSHKLNNALGQALIARALGRGRLIAETGAGQHGVATATAAALLGLPCRVYMGAHDVARQRLNVVRMELLGAEVVAVESGSRTLKDATNEAIRDWMGSYRDTHYVIGSVVGPHPYPTIVRTLQRVIGVEARAQILDRDGRLPSALVACVGGGSNALGLFHAFVDDDDVAMFGVEAGGSGDVLGAHSASLSRGTPGVLHGALSYLLQDDHGRVAATHSIAAGLDYPGVGPEHAWLRDTQRARYVTVSDVEALEAYRALARLEGIIPALESAHAIAYAMRLARELSADDAVLVCLSGRGDKDVGREDTGPAPDETDTGAGRVDAGAGR